MCNYSNVIVMKNPLGFVEIISDINQKQEGV